MIYKDKTLKYKDDFRKLLEKDLGDYIPNKVDLDNLVNYLYKSFIGIVKNDLKSDELSKVYVPNEVERQAFLRSVSVISLSASRNVLFDTLTSTFNNLKNYIPQSRSVSNINGNTTGNRLPNTESRLDKAPEAEFEINVSDLGPEFTEAYESASQVIEGIQVRQVQEKPWEVNEREFELDSSFIEKINNRSLEAIQQANGIAKSVLVNPFIVTSSESKPFNIESVNNSNNDEEDVDNRMVKEAGLLSSATFKREIEVSTDLDY